ncbi:MAG TPA: hypothetical protein ENJ56_05585 [Anaerolineae bacterium]|nr:hypothetical protein [Anaerolineae bacterium]
MLSLKTVFWISVIFFGMMGALRGWAKELVAAAGLVLSLFAIKTFGPFVLNVVGLADASLANPIDPLQIYRRQFWILSSIHLFIAFVSYEGPTLSNVGTRLKRSDSVQDKLLGWIFGTLNGWLIIGTLFSFLEFRVQKSAIDGTFQFVRLLSGEQYPFSAEIVTRPLNALALPVFQYLPLELFSGSTLLLPLIMVALFLVILIVIV